MWMLGVFIITVRGVSAFTVPGIHKQFCRGEVVFSGTVYVQGGGAQASRLTDAMGKGKFFSKHIGFSCQINVF